MIQRTFLPVWLAVVVIAGCTPAKLPETKIEQAMDLVAEKTGERPAWMGEPDADGSALNGKALVGEREAVATALRNNRMLRADLEMIGQADADLLQAGLLMNPMLNFMIMFPDGGGRSMLRANGLPTVPLQDLWMIPARKKVAKAQLQETVLRAADRAVATAAEVRKVYVRLQYTQRAVELVRENMEVVDQSTQIIRAQQTAGKATSVAVNLSQVRYLKLKSELIMLEAEHRAAQRELLMLMGVAAAGDHWKVEPIGEPATNGAAAADEVRMVSVAVEQRLDLKAAEWEVQAAQGEIDLMHAEVFKRFAVGLGLERAPAPPSNNQSWAGRFGNYSAQALVNKVYGMPGGAPMVTPFAPKAREVKWTLGPMLEMELPIFDWNQAKTARAEAMYRQRVAEYENRLQELIRMVREKVVMLSRAREQVGFYRDSILPTVQQNMEEARRAYTTGMEELTVYLEVQEDSLMTRLKLLEYFRDYRLARVELEREVGGRLELPGASTSQPASATQPG